MADIQRVTGLTEPPIVGQHYLVPTVRGKWCDKMGDWPVWGPKHEDGKFIGFPALHYHIDRRFLAGGAAMDATSHPLQEYDRKQTIGRGYIENDPLPPIVWRKRKCRSSHGEPFPLWRALRSENFSNLYSHYAGQQCRRGRGWICPHKGMDLGAMKPGDDGFIQCPLHGLLIDSETGVVSAHIGMPRSVQPAEGGE